MEKRKDDPLRRPQYVFDLPREIVDTLSLKPSLDDDIAQVDDKQSDLKTSSPPDSSPGSNACSLCGLSFANVQEQRSHLKSDWHNYNLRRKLRGHKPVTETEFEKLVEDLDESLSGSDSSDDEDEGAKKETTLSALLKKQATLADKNRTSPATAAADDDDDSRSSRRRPGAGSALLWLASPLLPEHTYYGVYKALFTNAELESEATVLAGIHKRQLAPVAAPRPAKEKEAAAPAAYRGPHIFLCMMGGGHFAAMVVALAPRQTKSSNTAAATTTREATVLAHKTFHRYTTRRKQGGAQGASDAAKGAAHSAGSSLRRYNEQALTEDVRSLLAEWKGLLDSADLLFVRANGATNRRTVFGPYDGQVLRSNDPRVRGFPFSTRRATQSELMRAFVEVTRLRVQEILPKPAAVVVPEAAQPKKTAAPEEPALTEEQEALALHTAQMQALIRRSKLPALLSYLAASGLLPLPPGGFRFFPEDHHAPTPLHLAASSLRGAGGALVVHGLLTKALADPTARNGDGRTPFQLASDRATRDAFRVARAELGEDRWAWGDGGDGGAKVPPAMSRQEADARAAAEKEAEDAEERGRRRREEDRLKNEGAGTTAGQTAAGAAGAGRASIAAAMKKTAQEKRDDESRTMTPEQRTRLERERRARAAEERIRRMREGGGQ